MNQKDKNVLCVKRDKYGTLDLWLNDEDYILDNLDNESGEIKYHIVATYNGETPDKGYSYMLSLSKEPTKAIDELWLLLNRDIINWGFKDIVLHWGGHKMKFINERNITQIEKDAYVKNLEDISMHYNIEW